VSYEDISYEGYGPEGVAIIVECVTDNKNRCVSEVRHAFTKHNGKMAEPGAVAWMFKETGRVEVEGEGIDGDSLLLAAMDAGADDVVDDDGTFEILCPTDGVEKMVAAVTDAGFKVSESGRVKVPANTVQVEGKGAGTLLRLLEHLESLDDVQNVWSNFEMDDSLLDSLE